MRVAFVYGPRTPLEEREIDRIEDVSDRGLQIGGPYHWGCKVAKKVYGDVYVEGVSVPLAPAYLERFGEELDGVMALVHVSDPRPDPDLEWLNFVRGRG